MATEYKLNYTASEINQKLATVDETKNTLENSYYNSLEIEGMFEQANSEVEASLATKADLVDGKVPIEQLPENIGGDFTQIQSDFAQSDSAQPDYIKNKPIYNIIINQETGKVEQSLDEIVAAAQSGMVLVCAGALSLITDNVMENGSYVMIQLTIFALPNTVIPANIYADGTVEMELSDNMQMKSDRVTSISEESTDAEYPTAKAVYDALQNVGGGVSEWNDIQNKPGDSTTETTTTTTFLSANNLSLAGIFFSGAYYGTLQVGEERPNVGDVVHLDFTFANNTEVSADVEVHDGDSSTPLIIVFNTNTLSSNEIANSGFSKIDDGEPALCIVYAPIQYSMAQIMSSETIEGASIDISKTESTTSYVKLPNEALNLDAEPTEGSTNFINSGDLYNIIGDIDTAISQLESMIGGAST